VVGRAESGVQLLVVGFKKGLLLRDAVSEDVGVGEVVFEEMFAEEVVVVGCSVVNVFARVVVKGKR
jgi:hypothetical protein